jgi:ABC-type amino acid transport substrate-binding protein
MNRAVASALAALLLAGPAAAADVGGTLKKIRDSGAIALGYRESSVPFSFIGADHAPTGYSIDLCRQVVGALQQALALPKLETKWVKVTPDDRMASVAGGAVDLECGSTTNTLSREEQVDFSVMTFVDGGSLLVATASGIKGVRDLPGKKLAVIAGTTTEKGLAEWFRANGVTGVKVLNVKDHQEGLAGLDGGAFDAYASDRVILFGLAANSKDVGRLTLLEEYFSYEPYGLMLRRGDPDFRLAVNRALARLYRSRAVIPIYEKWFGPINRATTIIQSMYLLNGLPE